MASILDISRVCDHSFFNLDAQTTQRNLSVGWFRSRKSGVAAADGNGACPMERRSGWCRVPGGRLNRAAGCRALHARGGFKQPADSVPDRISRPKGRRIFEAQIDGNLAAPTPRRVQTHQGYGRVTNILLLHTILSLQGESDRVR